MCPAERASDVIYLLFSSCKSPLTQLVAVRLVTGTLKSDAIRAGVETPVGCSRLAVP